MISKNYLLFHLISQTNGHFIYFLTKIFRQFFLTVLASTLPVPSGSLIPIFKIGAAFGRIIGEAMHLWFPEGIRIGSIISPILPGASHLIQHYETCFDLSILIWSLSRRLRDCWSSRIFSWGHPFDFHLRCRFGNDRTDPAHHPRSCRRPRF